MDYLIPTALEVPDWELGETVTPSPHHPIGAKGVGESPTVGSPPAIVNAVIDALHEPYGVDHIDMPLHARRGCGRRCREGRRRRSDRRHPRRARAGSCATARTPFVHGDGRPRRSARRACAAGDTALVLGDGTIEGFVGGVCARGERAPARPARARDRRAAAAADPAPSPARTPRSRRREGAVTAHNPCLSGGGARDLPRAAAARAAGWRSSARRRSRGRSRELGPGVGFEVRRGARRATTRRSWWRRTAATRRPRCAAALSGGVPYVGLVASTRRGAAVRGRRSSVPDALRARLHTPAGLDIGARTRGRRSRCRSWPRSSRSGERSTPRPAAPPPPRHPPRRPRRGCCHHHGAG